VTANSTAPRSSRKLNKTQQTAGSTRRFPLQVPRKQPLVNQIKRRLIYFGHSVAKTAIMLFFRKVATERLPSQFRSREGRLVRRRLPRQVTADSDGLRVGELCNKFLHVHRQRAEAKEPEITIEACDLLVAEAGAKRAVADLRQEDFQAIKAEMAKRWGALRVAKFITLIRSQLGSRPICVMRASPRGLTQLPGRFDVGGQL